MRKIMRKIKIVSVCVLLGIGTFTFQIANEKYKENGIMQAVSAQITNQRTVIIDAGHGVPDGGAVSSNGVVESEINLEIAMKVKNILEQNDINVILTREDENGIYDEDAGTIKQKKSSDLKNRVEIGNNSSADMLVSIHLNKIEQEQYFGYQCFFKENNEQSELLANSIQEGLNEAIQRENKRVTMKINNIYLVDRVTIPITIVECGFLSNNEEELLLQEDAYQDKLAWGIYLGILKYYDEQAK